LTPARDQSKPRVIGFRPPRPPPRECRRRTAPSGSGLRQWRRWPRSTSCGRMAPGAQRNGAARWRYRRAGLATSRLRRSRWRRSLKRRLSELGSARSDPSGQSASSQAGWHIDAVRRRVWRFARPGLRHHIRSTRITTVTLSVLQRPPRCVYRFTRIGDANDHTCVS
jgi:hypothetical protein